MNGSRLGLAGATAALGVATLMSACSSSGQAEHSPTPRSSSPSMSSSSASSSKSPSSDSASASARITIKDFTFSGATSVAPGTKITVQNDDSEAHTVTADSGSAFDVKIDPGASATFSAPAKPGTYAYHCSFHSNMHGTLRVG